MDVERGEVFVEPAAHTPVLASVCFVLFMVLLFGFWGVVFCQVARLELNRKRTPH